uniref:Uncharacterized protein n=1 Tax=Anas platyrhynchos platyrhynchos TaxID=8840 RepID=A0A493SWS0_ANAPP
MRGGRSSWVVVPPGAAAGPRTSPPRSSRAPGGVATARSPCSRPVTGPEGLHLVTWNVGTASPPPDVTSLLQLNSLGPTMDMYVIG